MPSANPSYKRTFHFYLTNLERHFSGGGGVPDLQVGDGGDAVEVEHEGVVRGQAHHGKVGGGPHLEVLRWRERARRREAAAYLHIFRRSPFWVHSCYAWPKLTVNHAERYSIVVQRDKKSGQQKIYFFCFV